MDIVKLFGTQVFLLRIHTRPNHLTSHETTANALHLRGERRVFLVSHIDSQNITTSDLPTRQVIVLEFLHINTLRPPLDTLAQRINTHILAIQHHLHHTRTRSPMPHLPPQGESEDIAQQRHVVVWGEQDPIRFSWHAKKTYIH